MLKLIDNETKRLLNILPVLDPSTDAYVNALRNLQTMTYLRSVFKQQIEKEQKLGVKAQLPWEEPIAPMQMPEEKSIIPKEEPIVIKNVDEVLTKDVVRARLQGASEKGVHIQPIIAKFVPDGKPIRFSSVPESEYTALIKELYDAQNK